MSINIDVDAYIYRNFAGTQILPLDFKKVYDIIKTYYAVVTYCGRIRRELF